MYFNMIGYDWIEGSAFVDSSDKPPLVEMMPLPNPDMNPKHTRDLRKTKWTHGMSPLNLYYLNGLHMLTRSHYVKNAKITKTCCKMNG